MKEQFQNKLEDLENRKSLLLAVTLLIALTVINVVNSGSDLEVSSSNKLDKTQVGVGQDAWGNVKHINISESINPSKVSLESSDTLIWQNNNDFSVKIELKSTNKEFNVSAGGKQVFKPSSGFEYGVVTEEEILDEGRVVITSER